MNALAHQPPQIARANGIDICYEIFGDPNAEPMLLIMGLGAQMIHWDDDFCRQLAARGFRVIRFDNRDIGKSSKLSGGKRIFKMSPLHHHYELSGWDEEKITLRFWIVGIIAGLIGVTLFLGSVSLLQ